jgi:hypothetical protein
MIFCPATGTRAGTIGIGRVNTAPSLPGSPQRRIAAVARVAQARAEPRLAIVGGEVGRAEADHLDAGDVRECLAAASGVVGEAIGAEPRDRGAREPLAAELVTRHQRCPHVASQLRRQAALGEERRADTEALECLERALEPSLDQRGRGRCDHTRALVLDPRLVLELDREHGRTSPGVAVVLAHRRAPARRRTSACSSST